MLIIAKKYVKGKTLLGITKTHDHFFSFSEMVQKDENNLKILKHFEKQQRQAMLKEL